MTQIMASIEMHSLEPPSTVAMAAPMFLKDLRLQSRYWLSPLAGYTNLPFRRIVREAGGLGLATTDLVNARALLKESRKSLELVETCPEDTPVAIQIYGAEQEFMIPAAQWVESHGADVIDINMGCPVHKITKGGGGSAMLCNTDGSTVELVRKVVAAVRVPVTVKMRLGWDEHNHTAPYFARAFEDVGVAGIIIHGRTREQGFSGRVDLDGIRNVVEAVRSIPVIGNGDIRNVADAQHMMKVTGCTGISVGRGALLNPWIFRQLARFETTGDAGPSGEYHERIRLMARHYELLVAQRGGHFASLTFRKVANWYCRVLKPGREIQQGLVMVKCPDEFAALVERLHQKGPPRGWHESDMPEIAVPKGPIEHW